MFRAKIDCKSANKKIHKVKHTKNEKYHTDQTKII